MKQITKRAVLAVLTTFGVTAALTVVTAPDASAIDNVPCGPSDYLQIDYHDTGGASTTTCWANAGEYDFGGVWVTRITTGANRVQWYGDGRWQPDQPIDRWTIFTWPGHPDGVRMDKIKIL